MWRVEEHNRVDKELQGVPKEIVKRYEKWKDIARLSGPAGLRQIKGFHDERLSGKWKGYRSSRLGLQYRLIYQLVSNEQLFRIVSITAHDYRRR